ncbi:hypothetical protein [Bifidobacterium sp. ESL0745]|uniref:hypothetical protein n=1 Tax=Bifidobacterium sp. ESL0745 TaxID=2983226 RepID=UPI0023F7212B|nr:hypothetical protein [Bifidobacterium sp. ESL0745]MDF7664923.1 hypothetical protein [Bifidobacterium sp. ESL0745]
MKLGAVLFYKCRFDISLSDSSEYTDLLWQILLDIKKWIHHKRYYNFLKDNTDLTYAKSGTNLYRHDNNVDLSLSTASVTNYKNIAQEWACEFCEKRKAREVEGVVYAPREWMTEIGFRQSEDSSSAQFSLIVSYLDQPGFIGPSKNAPVPSVPALIRILVEDGTLKCTKSGFDITKMNMVVGNGGISAEKFWNLVRDEDRDYPILYISPDSQGRYPVDPFDLDTKLYPNALVCSPQSADEDREIMRKRPIVAFNYQPYSIRLFATHPRLNNKQEIYRDLRRHRCLSSKAITQLREGQDKKDTDSVENILRQALAQDVHSYETDDLISLSDVKDDLQQSRLEQNLVESKQHFNDYKEKLEKLSASIATQVNQTIEYEQPQHSQTTSVKDLQAQITGLLDNLKSSRNNADDMLKLAKSYESDLSKSQQNNYELQTKNYNLINRLSNLEKGGEGKNDYLEIQQLITSSSPQNLMADNTTRNHETDIKIVTFFAAIFSDRIVVTKEAYESLKDCVTRPNYLWQAMYMMCQPLYRTYKETKNSNITKTFLEQDDVVGGFTVALHEGHETHKDDDYMNLRKVGYQGHIISIESHLKRGGGKDDSRSVRIYYCWAADKTGGKLVIGHIGKHLKNYSTHKLN